MNSLKYWEILEKSNCFHSKSQITFIQKSKAERKRGWNEFPLSAVISFWIQAYGWGEKNI